MMSRYSKVRQINKDSAISTFLVEDRLHHGRFFDLKIFKPSAILQLFDSKQYHQKYLTLSPENSFEDAPLPTTKLVRQQLGNSPWWYQNNTSTTLKFDVLDLLSKLTELRHPFICQYYEFFVQTGIVHVITEHAHPGRLDFLIDECFRMNELIDETLALRWMAQLLIALIYFEQQCIYVTRLTVASAALFNSNANYPVAKLVDVETNGVVDTEGTLSSVKRSSKHQQRRQVLTRHLGVVAFELLTLRKFNSKYPSFSGPTRLSRKCRDLLARMILSQELYTDYQPDEHRENSFTDQPSVQPFYNYEEILLTPLMNKIVRQLFNDTPGLMKLHPELSQMLTSRTPTIPIFRGNHAPGLLKYSTVSSEDAEISCCYEQEHPIVKDEIATSYLMREPLRTNELRTINLSPDRHRKIKSSEKVRSSFGIHHQRDTYKDYRNSTDDPCFFSGPRPPITNGSQRRPSQTRSSHDLPTDLEYKWHQPTSRNPTATSKRDLQFCAMDGQQVTARGFSVPLQQPKHLLGKFNSDQSNHLDLNQYHYRSPNETHNARYCHYNEDKAEEYLRFNEAYRYQCSEHSEKKTHQYNHRTIPSVSSFALSSPVKPRPQAIPLLRSDEQRRPSQDFNGFREPFPHNNLYTVPGPHPAAQPSHHSIPRSLEDKRTCSYPGPIEPNESLSITMKSPSLLLKLTTAPSTTRSVALVEENREQRGATTTKAPHGILKNRSGEIGEKKNSDWCGPQIAKIPAPKRQHSRCRSQNRPAIDRPTVASKIRSDEVSREYQWLKDQGGLKGRVSRTSSHEVSRSDDRHGGKHSRIGSQHRCGMEGFEPALDNRAIVKTKRRMYENDNLVIHDAGNFEKQEERILLPPRFRREISDINRSTTVTEQPMQQQRSSSISSTVSRRSGDARKGGVYCAPIHIQNLSIDGNDPDELNSNDRDHGRSQFNLGHPKYIQSNKSITKSLPSILKQEKPRHVSFSTTKTAAIDVIPSDVTTNAGLDPSTQQLLSTSRKMDMYWTSEIEKENSRLPDMPMMFRSPTAESQPSTTASSPEQMTLVSSQQSDDEIELQPRKKYSQSSITQMDPLEQVFSTRSTDFNGFIEQNSLSSNKNGNMFKSCSVKKSNSQIGQNHHTNLLDCFAA